MNEPELKKHMFDLVKFAIVMTTILTIGLGAILHESGEVGFKAETSYFAIEFQCNFTSDNKEQ